MVRSEPGSEQEKSAAAFRNRMQDRNRIQGPGQTQHQGRVCWVWP
ncbi:unnamed protein product, partial [Staurois parvus]